MMKHAYKTPYPLPLQEEIFEQEPPFVLVYGLMAFSGFIMGLFAGWLIWS